MQVGLRPVLLFGISITIIGSILFGFSTSLSQVLTVRFLAGPTPSLSLSPSLPLYLAQTRSLLQTRTLSLAHALSAHTHTLSTRLTQVLTVRFLAVPPPSLSVPVSLPPISPSLPLSLALALADTHAHSPAHTLSALTHTVHQPLPRPQRPLPRWCVAVPAAD